MNTREAVLIHVRDLAFIGKAGSNHWTSVDSAHKGKVPAATSPMEMVLIALGGCTGGDVASILEKKRVKFSKLEVKVSGVSTETDPQVYTSIHIDYLVEGSHVREKVIAHAVELSMTKYCSVGAMLKKSVTLTHAFTVIDTEAKEGGS